MNFTDSVRKRITYVAPKSRNNQGANYLSLKKLCYLLSMNVRETGDNLNNLISVQSHRSTRSSDIITLSWPPSSSSLKVNNRSSSCITLPLESASKELRLPTDHKDLSLSSDLTHVSSSFPASPLSPSITPSHFHSRLKTHLFQKSFPP